MRGSMAAPRKNEQRFASTAEVGDRARPALAEVGGGWQRAPRALRRAPTPAGMPMGRRSPCAESWWDGPRPRARSPRTLQWAVVSVSTEGKRELTQSHAQWSFGRRLRREAMLGEQPGDGGRFGSCLDPAHRPATARASLHLGAEHMPEQPAPPGPAPCRRRGGAGSPAKLELVARSVRNSMP